MERLALEPACVLLLEGRRGINFSPRRSPMPSLLFLSHDVLHLRRSMSPRRLPCRLCTGPGKSCFMPSLLPLIVLGQPGHEGKMTRPEAITVKIHVCASLIDRVLSLVNRERSKKPL